MSGRRGAGWRVGAMAAVLALVAAGVAWWRVERRPGAPAATPRIDARSRESRVAGGRGGTARVEPRAATGRIRGHVRDATGQPVQDAAVCARFGYSELPEDETRAPRCTTSGADGGYSLVELWPAEYGVSASAPGRRPALYRGPRPGDDSLTLAVGEARDGIDLVLADGGVEIRGKVKDISGGAVAGALVEIVRQEREDWVEGAPVFAHTDTAGDFVAWGEPGDVGVRASAEGYGEGWARGSEPGTTLEILLTPESVLVGRVVEAGGAARPVPHVRVIASSNDDGFATVGDPTPSYGADAFTDDDGRFRIERLAPGRYKPVANAPGLVGVAAASVLLGLGETSDEIVIEVHPAAIVRGTLRGGGAPCAHGSVDLRDPASEHGASASTGAAGAVVFTAVMPGHYRVSARCDGFVEAEDLPPIDVAAKDLDGLTWSLPAGARVHGHVVDATGRGVGRAMVIGQANAEDRRAPPHIVLAHTETDGHFVLEGVPKGALELSAGASSFPNLHDRGTRIDVQGDVDDVKLTLDPTGTIEGVVVDEDGAPVAQVDVRARSKGAGGRRGANMSRDDGSFRIDDLPAGAYWLTPQEHWVPIRLVDAREDVPGLEASVTRDAVTRVRLRVVARHARLTGRVLDAAGRPVTDAYVDGVREPDGGDQDARAIREASRWEWRGKPALTDPDGRFELGSLALGSYTVHAYRKGGGEAFVEHVATGTDVAITIAATGSIAGTVVTARGGPPEEFRVTVSDRASGFSRREAFLRVGGRFTMGDLPAGALTVTVEATGSQASLEVPLAAGENRSGLQLTLAALVTLRGTVVALDTGKPLAGYQVTVRTLLGEPIDRRGSLPGDDQDVTDASGRFEITSLPAGRLIVTGYSRDGSDSAYGPVSGVANLVAGADTDVGPLLASPRRLEGGRTRGELGFAVVQTGSATSSGPRRFLVGFVRPGGPAASAGMLVGDEVVTVEGQDVAGMNASRFFQLASVAEGTAVTVGVKRAASPAPVMLRIVAGKRTD